jgi:hypothetical protein
MIFKRKLSDVWNGESGDATAVMIITAYSMDASPVRVTTIVAITWCIVHR